MAFCTHLGRGFNYRFASILILIIHSLHTVADGGQHLIRNGIEDVAERLNREMLTENLYGITLLTVDARNINHRHIHADVAHILRLLTIHQTISMAIAQVTVQAIGITDRDGCDDTVLIQDGLARIAHALTCLDVVHLENSGLQGTHTVDGLIVARVDAIEAKTQAAHIQLALWEVLDTRRIADMAQYLVVESCLQLFAALVKQLKLVCRESIEAIIIATHKEIGRASCRERVLRLV